MKSEPRWRKQVNQNGWMVKLQRLCFGGATPKFAGYCPFFWFTWFCLIFCVVIVPFRLLITSFVGAVRALNELKSRRPMRPKDAVLLKFYDHYWETGKNLGVDRALAWEREHNAKAFAEVLAWIDKTPDWENCCQQAWVRRDFKKKSKEARAARNVERSKKISGFAGFMGRVIKPVLFVAAILLSYKVIKFFASVAITITWRELVIAGQVAIFLLVVASGTTMVVNVVEALIKWRKRCPTDPNKTGFWTLFYTVACIPFEFILDTIETIYTRECPLIEWGDENSPIESRDEVE